MKILSLVRQGIQFEFRMWRSLCRWIARRPVAAGPNAQPFGYAATVTPLLLAFIGVSVVEIPILHFLLPWLAVRLVILAASVYGLLWMFGLLASLRVHPHVVSDDGIRLRNGVSLDLALDWEDVAAVRRRNRSLHSGRGAQVESSDAGLILNLGVMSQTNVDIVLREPVTFALPNRDPVTVIEVRCYADDPSAFAAHAHLILT